MCEKLTKYFNISHIADKVQYFKHSKKFMKMTNIEINVTEFLMN